MLDLLAPIRRSAVEDDGQTMAEYSVVLSVVTLAALGALALLGAHVISAIQRVSALF